MKEYTLEDIKVGIKHSFDVLINDTYMQKFIDISGDYNPMHIDKEYAQSKGMRDIVVYGMLTSTFYSKLVGVYLPGKYALLHSIDIQFTKPVFIGDKLVVVGEVHAINKIFRQIEVKAFIVNQNLEKVSKAKIKVGIINE